MRQARQQHAKGGDQQSKHDDRECAGIPSPAQPTDEVLGHGEKSALEQDDVVLFLRVGGFDLKPDRNADELFQCQHAGRFFIE